MNLGEHAEEPMMTPSGCMSGAEGKVWSINHVTVAFYFILFLYISDHYKTVGLTMHVGISVTKVTAVQLSRENVKITIFS